MTVLLHPVAMTQVGDGNVVRVHYKGTLANGTVFDSSENKDPLEFRVGEGRVIPGFEDAVRGLAPGETVTTKIPPEKAYGARRHELLFHVPKEKFPAGVEPRVGQLFQLRMKDGENASATVREVAAEKVVLDANHPLAGEELTFELNLVEIVT